MMTRRTEYHIHLRINYLDMDTMRYRINIVILNSPE